MLGQKFFKKIVGILVEMMKPKGHFKINRPLVGDQTLLLEFFEKLDI